MDYFVWKQLLKNLVLPPTGPLLLAALGLALLVLRRRRLGGIVVCAHGPCRPVGAGHAHCGRFVGALG